MDKKPSRITMDNGKMLPGKKEILPFRRGKGLMEVAPKFNSTETLIMTRAKSKNPVAHGRPFIRSSFLNAQKVEMISTKLRAKTPQFACKSTITLANITLPVAMLRLKSTRADL